VIVPLSPSTNMHAACMSNESSMHTYKSHTCGICVCSMFKILVCHMQVNSLHANYLCAIYMQTACMDVTNMPHVCYADYYTWFTHVQCACVHVATMPHVLHEHMHTTHGSHMCQLHVCMPMPHVCYLNICTINS